MVNLFNPGLWLGLLLSALAIFGAGAMKGGEWERAKQTKETLDKTQEVRKSEQAAAVDVNAEAVNLRKKLDEQEKRSKNEISNLKKKLAAMPDCRVPGDVVGMLDPDSSDMPTNSTTGQHPGGRAKAPDSTCAVELETCARNYREVCLPNYEQVKGLQGAYNKVRDRYNSQ